MNIFSKRNVPGLEDCSDSEEDEDLIPYKKQCKKENVDEELELEVQNNEFLQECVDDSKCNKRINNVWGCVVQDDLLNDELNNVGVNKKFNVKRSIESYSLPDSNKRKRRRSFDKGGRRKIKNNRSPVNKRIQRRTYDKSKDRSHVNINPLVNTSEEIITEIAKHLHEPKLELIEKCYFALGLDRCLEFLYLTEDIEEFGGLMINDGSRRRTPGGVFLQLIKDSDDVRMEDKNKIFQNNLPPQKNSRSYDKNNGHRRSNSEKSKRSNTKLHLETSQSMNGGHVSSLADITDTSGIMLNYPPLVVGDDLEEGEII